MNREGKIQVVFLKPISIPLHKRKYNFNDDKHFFGRGKIENKKYIAFLKMSCESNYICFYCRTIFSRHDNIIKHYKNNKCNTISQMSHYDHYMMILPLLEKAKYNEYYQIPTNSIFSDHLKYNTIKTMIESIPTSRAKEYMESEIIKYIDTTIRYINKQANIYMYNGNRCTLKEATDLLSDYLINKFKINISLFKTRVTKDDSFDYDLYDTEVEYLYMLSEKTTMSKELVEKTIQKSKIRKLVV